MKYKLSLLIVMLLLISVSVTAIGEAGKPYNFFNVEKCVGNITVRVYVISAPGGYSLIDCSQLTTSDWTCPCSKSLYILTPTNSDSRLSALVQYYIGQIKPFTPSIDGKPTAEEQYNDALKRVYTIKDIVITKNKELTGGEAFSQNDKINKIMLGSLMVVGVIILLVFIVIALLWFYDDKLHKWMGLREEDKMTIGMILKKIFGREDISRKEFTRKKGEVLPVVKPVEKKTEIKVEKKTVDTQEEIRKLLEGLED
jgi:uncharacterized membrane protein